MDQIQNSNEETNAFNDIYINPFLMQNNNSMMNIINAMGNLNNMNNMGNLNNMNGMGNLNNMNNIRNLNNMNII